MRTMSVWLALVLLATGVALAEDAVQPAPDPNAPVTQQKEQDKEQVQEQEKKDQGPKAISGMSILGNQEAPKSLVIVPWKTSEIGDAFGLSTMLDDSRQPVDREVFLRELSYYQIRSKTTP